MELKFGGKNAWTPTSGIISPRPKICPTYSHGNGFRKLSVSLSMKDISQPSLTCRMEQKSEYPGELLVSQPGHASVSSDLNFDKELPSDKEFDGTPKRVFGHFIAREAKLDEEYWTAAWLRAECQWEDLPIGRFAGSYKRKFVEQEFNSLKRRCSSTHLADKCTCLIAVKNDEGKVKRIALNSIVGTLDVSIKQLSCRPVFTEKCIKPLIVAEMMSGTRPNQGLQKYGYISNLCISKLARLQGIATNLMHLAIEVAKSSGVEQIFVHVNKNNAPAQHLYEKIGFQMVEMATGSSDDANYLLRYNI